MSSRIKYLTAAAALAVTTSSFAGEGAATFQADFLAGKLSWQNVVQEAQKEGAVQFYYWGGSDELNVWIDSVAVPALAELGVKLVPNRITGTKDAVDLVLAEAASGRGIGEGSVDAIWLNGENFYTLSRQTMLFGSFAQVLPNADNFEWDPADQRSQLNFRDFGVETGSQEIPWSGEQYVCAVNRALVSTDETLKTFDDLKAYLEANPGKFTYVKPPNYVGNTFVQEVVYSFNPDGTGSAPFQKSLEDLGVDELARLAAPGFEYLRSIEPQLLGAASGNVRYPEDAAASRGLFANGETHIHCEFGLFAVATNRANGSYPETAEEVVFPAGNMIKNKNYLAIVANAPNPAAALVFANYMASVDAQASKLEVIGYPAGIDPWKLSATDAQRLVEAAPPHFGVTQDELDANIAPDTNASLVDVIEATWLEFIERKATKPLAEIMASAAADLAR